MELRLEHIAKSYGDNKALDNFSAVFTEGIYGILGPNGAGKSTLMNIICGLLKNDEGAVLYNGEQIQKSKKEYLNRLGYMPQVQTLYREFTIREFLYYIGALRDMEPERVRSRACMLLKKTGLYEKRHDKIRTLSGGMKQRLMLVQALLADPEILILDEPTAGLDPKQRIAVRNLILELSLHKIILISTHVVTDIEYIASECLLMQKGKMIKRGTQDNLCNELNGRVFNVKINEDEIDDIGRYGLISGMHKRGNQIHVRLIADQNIPYTHETADPDLEDVYLSCFGEESL